MNPDYKQDNIKIYNADCMAIMEAYPENYFDLAIVDPPYFDKASKKNFTGEEISNTGVQRNTFEAKSWDIPKQDYLDELKRVSLKQIIWGINYFEFYHAPGRIIWDKKNDSASFSKAEIASTNIHYSVQMFRYEWNGMIQEDMKHKEIRIHPTQKPIKLYSWIYENYALEGYKILDTHLGSGSNAIAAHYAKMGEFVGIEIDNDYFQSSIQRIYNQTRQLELF